MTSFGSLEKDEYLYKRFMKVIHKNIKVLCVSYDYVGPYSSFGVAGLVRIGEWYDAYEHENRYTIFDESGFVKCDLAKAYFKKIDEIREERLKEIGI